MQSGRLILLATAAALVSTLVACSTGPLADEKYFGAQAPEADPRLWPREGSPRIALSGIIQLEKTASGKSETRLIKESPELEALLSGIRQGLSTEASIAFAPLATFPFEFACFPAGVGEPAEKHAACVLPPELTLPTAADPALDGFSHMLIVLGSIRISDSETWTDVGGAGTVGVFSWGRTSKHDFNVSAGVYELVRGTLATVVAADDFASGDRGVAMLLPIPVPIPLRSAPDDSKFMQVMGNAVGVEVGRRFRLAHERRSDSAPH